jgi:hypothetical protein
MRIGKRKKNLWYIESVPLTKKIVIKRLILNGLVILSLIQYQSTCVANDQNVDCLEHQNVYLYVNRITKKANIATYCILCKKFDNKKNYNVSVRIITKSLELIGGSYDIRIFFLLQQDVKRRQQEKTANTCSG